MQDANENIVSLSPDELDLVEGGLIPVVVFGAAFALGMTGIIAAYAATHQ